MRCPRCHTVWPDELAGMLKYCGACAAPLAEPPAPATPAGGVQEPGGGERISESWLVSRMWLSVAEALLANQPLEPALAWFREKGFTRALASLERMQRAV